MANKKSVEEWEAAFKEADKDNSGSLDVKELTAMLRKNNCNITDSQIAETFIYLDGAQGDRRITLEEFVKGLESLRQFIVSLTALFKKYDADNSGTLDKSELREVLASSGHKFTDEEVDEILRAADTSGDGKISFQEFFDACT